MGLGQSRDANPDNGEASDDGMRDGLGIGIKSSGHHQHQYRYCQTPTLGTGSLGGPPPHTRSGSVRSTPRQPMPDTIELERRFTKVLQ
ncbi:hypothetical protein KQX54_018672 [Cotesia glomerata]|uniref:Uncharacterized protein n=1 Tax=Cotesia glomerata TaxID=32391 RepID=A0AAV7J0A1_COTGL|nr:hypothetical protein KQX54_018672 [Cotesia glomerata]